MSYFKYYNHLGNFGGFHCQINDSVQLDRSFQSLVEKRGMDNKLNPVSILSMLSFGHMIGDNTILKNIFRNPWMGRLNHDEWEYFQDVHFGDDKVNLEKFTEGLFKLLKDEIKSYIGESTRIGILLSGGMDSRICAGVVQSLIDAGELDKVNIIGLTWGNKNCRDSIYGERIATRLKWDWRHFDIGPEEMYANIVQCGIRGSEYSPHHLHAMLSVREENDIDCILAASFGDSIGRGEYSGKTVKYLKDFRQRINDRYGFLNKEYFDVLSKEIQEDIGEYRLRFTPQEEYQMIERDYQIHYMRRMLNPCLSVINEKIPVYQIFTDPRIVKLIWSLDPDYRDNRIYKLLMSMFSRKLSDIPWSRTGLIFDELKGSPDKLVKNYDTHFYSKLINRDLKNEIKTLVISSNIGKMGIFNMKSLENTFKIMESPFYVWNKELEETLTWIASLSVSIDKFSIENSNSELRSIKDTRHLNIYRESMVFSLKYFYRKYYLGIEQ